MTITKPTKYADFALNAITNSSGNPNKLNIPVAYQNNGFPAHGYVPSQYINEMWDLQGQWIRWLDGNTNLSSSELNILNDTSSYAQSPRLLGRYGIGKNPGGNFCDDFLYTGQEVDGIYDYHYLSPLGDISASMPPSATPNPFTSLFPWRFDTNASKFTIDSTVGSVARMVLTEPGGVVSLKPEQSTSKYIAMQWGIGSLGLVNVHTNGGWLQIRFKTPNSFLMTASFGLRRETGDQRFGFHFTSSMLMGEISNTSAVSSYKNIGTLSTNTWYTARMWSDSPTSAKMQLNNAAPVTITSSASHMDYILRPSFKIIQDPTTAALIDFQCDYFQCGHMLLNPDEI